MPRKTPGPRQEDGLERTASMRPRPDATENAGGTRAHPRAPARFNEAAARCHGKLRRPPMLVFTLGRLQ